MSNLDVVAAQRDEANTKLRQAVQERDRALAQVALLTARLAEVEAQRGAVPVLTSEVPHASPAQSKRARIFGSKP